MEIEALVNRVCRFVLLDDCEDLIEKNVVSLMPSKKMMEIILKKRIHVATQACPDVTYSMSQTNPPLPTNRWTQYVYNVVMDEVLSDQPALEFTQETKERTEAYVEFSGAFDIFKQDYANLVQDTDDTQADSPAQYTDYQSFVEVVYCKNKEISCASWHPVNQGIVAVSYVHQTCHNIQRGESDFDEVSYKSFPCNVILIWNIEKDLRPQLILSCPADVYAVQFCPFNDDLIAAGCINGQVALWDIKKHTDNEPIAHDVEKSFCASHMFINWKNVVKRITVLKPVKYSLPETSHPSCIQNIQWVISTLKINDDGKFRRKENEETCLQFISCSEDGLVCVWTLTEDICVARVNDYNSSSPAERERSIYQTSKLLSERNISPTYKLLCVDLHENKLCPSAMTFSVFEERFDEESDNLTDSVGNSKYDMGLPDQPAELWLGKFDGTIQISSWKGIEFSSGKKNIIEKLSHVFSKQVHDGPVTCIASSPWMNGVMLSVGGHIFALWINTFKEGPVLLKNNSRRITHCSWSPTEPEVFQVSYIDGTIEVWNLLSSCEVPLFCQDLSGNLITGVYPTRLTDTQNILGVACSNGGFRTFCFPSGNLCQEIKVKALLEFLQKQAICLSGFGRAYGELTERDRASSSVTSKSKVTDLPVKEEERDRLRSSIIQQIKPKQTIVKRIKKPKVFVAKDYRNRQLWIERQEKYMASQLLDKKKLNQRQILSDQELFFQHVRQRQLKFKRLDELTRDKCKILQEEECKIFPSCSRGTFTSNSIEDREQINYLSISVSENIEDYTGKMRRMPVLLSGEHKFEWSGKCPEEV